MPQARHRVRPHHDRYPVRHRAAERAGPGRSAHMIAFLHPWWLAALALAAVPIILHLRQQREPPTVAFPAVRYLLDATRQHQQRLRLRHWLLLLLRTLLIIALVLAAAGPTAPVGGVSSHPPTALVIVLDNSLSSGVVAGGTPRLDNLRRAAREVLDR